MKTSPSDLLLSLGFGMTILGGFALIFWVFVSTWNRRKAKNWSKAKKRHEQATLRRVKEAEAREAAMNDTLLREAQAFYDGI